MQNVRKALKVINVLKGAVRERLTTILATIYINFTFYCLVARAVEGLAVATVALVQVIHSLINQALYQVIL